MGRDPVGLDTQENVETLILDHGMAVLLNCHREGRRPLPRTLYDAFLWYAYEQGLLDGLRGHLGEQEVGRAFRLRVRNQKQNRTVKKWAARIASGTVAVNGRIVCQLG